MTKSRRAVSLQPQRRLATWVRIEPVTGGSDNPSTNGRITVNTTGVYRLILTAY